MSLSFVQYTVGGGGVDAAMYATFVSTPTNGNLIVALCDWQNIGTRALSEVTDNAGNLYHPLTSQHTTTGEWMTQIWYAYNITGVSSHKVTGTFTGSGGFWCGIEIFEVQGVIGTGDPLDDECGNAANSLSGPDYDFDGGTLTPSQPGGLMLCVNKYGTATFLDEYPADSTDPFGGTYISIRYSLLATTAPYPVAFSFTGISPPCCSAVLFKGDTSVWVPIAEWVEPEIDGARYPSGTARVVCEAWNGAPGVTAQLRLYNTTDGASAGESATYTSTTATDQSFAVALAAGVKRYRLEVMADTEEVDLFCQTAGVVS